MRLNLQLLALPACLPLALLLSCAGSLPSLVSIAISPNQASAINASKGTVQFTATGTYSNGKVITPLPVVWFAPPPWLAPKQGITISSTGLAQCSGVQGSISIVAIAPEYANEPLSYVKSQLPQGLPPTLVAGSGLITCK